MVERNFRALIDKVELNQERLFSGKDPDYDAFNNLWISVMNDNLEDISYKTYFEAIELCITSFFGTIQDQRLVWENVFYRYKESLKDPNREEEFGKAFLDYSITHRRETEPELVDLFTDWMRIVIERNNLDVIASVMHLAPYLELWGDDAKYPEWSVWFAAFSDKDFEDVPCSPKATEALNELYSHLGNHPEMDRLRELKEYYFSKYNPNHSIGSETNLSRCPRSLSQRLRNSVRFFLKHKFLFLLIVLIVVKGIWMIWSLWGIGSVEGEKEDLLQRKNYLVEKIVVEPQELLNEMPRSIGHQFQGEWALYSCSMLTEALSNIAELYPETREDAITQVDNLIQIVKSPELGLYDKMRWGEDPLESLDGDESHVSYLSHLAWMIGNYKRIGGDNKYDALHESLCHTMNRRIVASPMFNLPTYPGEPIYVPDMLVAIVALSDYSKQNHGKYGDTVAKWMERAQTEWLDEKTGLLVSFLDENGKVDAPVKGSYSALNCYYLTKIAPEFAHEQYEKLKSNFSQSFPLSGIKEYHDHSCWLGMDIDAGPIIMNLSPTGTAFAIGSATYFDDHEFRNKLLRTAEIAGHTIKWNEKRHYLLADMALVGEAITLAMRTNHLSNEESIIEIQSIDLGDLKNYGVKLLAFWKV